MDIFDCDIITADCTNGQPEDTNGGHYLCRQQFRSPMVGTYLTREVWSYHGDIEPMPPWQPVTLGEYHRAMRSALKAEAEL